MEELQALVGRFATPTLLIDGETMNELSLKRLLRYLVIYYGLWQLIHFFSNLSAFLISMDYTRSFLGGTMTDDQFKALLASGVIDLFFVSPVGIIFAYGYIRRRRWSIPLGLISMTAAMYSAYLYVYLHTVYGTMTFDPLQFFLLWGLFIPCILLFILFVWLNMKQGTDWFFKGSSNGTAA